MARARNIKPGLYKNEDLAECSIWARFIFPGLWMLADREGRLEDRPKRIKGELLPYDTVDVEPLLRELAAKQDAEGVPFIIRYQIDGIGYIQISKFSTHQTPHYSEKASVIKPPPFPEIVSDMDDSDSGNSPGLKGGSQPPDSLIPDSLIPESLKKTKSKANGHRKAEAFELPEWVPKMQWDAWVEARKKKRNAPTAFAMRLAVSKLEQLRDQGQNPAKVLAEAAYKGWTGLYEVKP